MRRCSYAAPAAWEVMDVSFDAGLSPGELDAVVADVVAQVELFVAGGQRNAFIDVFASGELVVHLYVRKARRSFPGVAQPPLRIAV